MSGIDDIQIGGEITDEPYKAIKIAEDAWRIEEQLVRFFLFIGKEEALLIDSGFGTGDLNAFLSRLTDLPIRLINTHADPDHVGGNKFFKSTTMHAADFVNYRQVTGDENTGPAFWEGDIIETGFRTFEVVLFSGHTPGSIAFLDRKNRLIVSGDVVQTNPVFLFGPMRSVPAYIESLKKLEGMAGDFDTIWPSHGSFPLEPSFISVQKAGALKLAAGELTGVDPPRPVPAKHYIADGVSFFY